MLDTKNDSYAVFGSVISHQQSYLSQFKCVFCHHEELIESNQFCFIRDLNNNIVEQFLYEAQCSVCNIKAENINGSFVSTPIWLFFDIHYKCFDEKVHCSDVPKFIRVNKLTYKLLCCQIIVNAQSKTAAHFKEVFLIDDCFLLVDDLYSKN